MTTNEWQVNPINELSVGQVGQVSKGKGKGRAMVVIHIEWGCLSFEDAASLAGWVGR